MSRINTMARFEDYEDDKVADVCFYCLSDIYVGDVGYEYGGELFCSDDCAESYIIEDADIKKIIVEE